MRATLRFVLLGPMLIAFAACLIVVWVGGPCAIGFVPSCAAISILFACFISAIAKPIDEGLAQVLSMPLRGPLIAVIGAAIAVGSILVLSKTMLPLWVLAPVAIAGAYCAGLCSLLSGDSSYETSTST